MAEPKTQEVPGCLFCEKAGEPLYPDVKDFVFENDGTFAFLRCPDCGLLWLSPRPVPEEMGKFYRAYPTHAVPVSGGEAADGRRLFGGLRDFVRDGILCGYYGYRHLRPGRLACLAGAWLGKLPPLRGRAAGPVRPFFPFYREGGRIVDVGCGRGDFLARMKELGWEVLGIETDPLAAAAAAARGIRVETRPLEAAGIPDEWADVVTMDHVVEHLYDPVAALKECRRILKKDGLFALATPNALSLGHGAFGRDWRGLEPPRHLNVFSPRAISAALERAGFGSVRVRTSARLAAGIYGSSLLISREGNLKGRAVPPQAGSRFFELKEILLCALGAQRGEELEVFAGK